MPLARDATLTDVMFAVGTAFDHVREPVLMVGGGAATYYAPHAYQSVDCDFIFQSDADRMILLATMRSIGFERMPESLFRHPSTGYTVELLRGPAYIGIDEIVLHATERRGDEVLHLYLPSDVVRDRLMHYWAWGDMTALRAALDVAEAQRARIDLPFIENWTAREMQQAPRAYDRKRAALMLRDLRTAVS